MSIFLQPTNFNYIKAFPAITLHRIVLPSSLLFLSLIKSSSTVNPHFTPQSSLGLVIYNLQYKVQERGGMATSAVPNNQVCPRRHADWIGIARTSANQLLSLVEIAIL